MSTKNELNTQNRWFWMMEYCNKKRISPADLWAWEEAQQAYDQTQNCNK